MTLPRACLLLCCTTYVAAERAPPRIAVCFVGHANAFADPRARANVVANLLGPLRRGGAVVDVIVRMKPGRDGTVEGVDDLGGVDVAAPPGNASYDHCGPVDVAAREARNAKWAHVFGEHGMQVCLGVASSFRACADAVRAREARAAATYDLVVRTRADLVFPEPVPRPCAWPTDEAIQAGCDAFLAGARDVVVPMLDAVWDDWAACRPGGCGAARVEDVVLRASRTVRGLAYWPEAWIGDGGGPPTIARFESVAGAVAAAKTARTSEPPCYEDAAPLAFVTRHC